LQQYFVGFFPPGHEQQNKPLPKFGKYALIVERKWKKENMKVSK